MKPKSKIIRSIAIILCLPFLLGTITRCGCDGREIHKDLDTTKGYFEDNRRPEGIEKYDDILYSFHKDELDRLEKIYLSDEPDSEERRNDEAIYWEYKYDLYSDWDKRIKLREIDGATREEAVKEITIEEMLKQETMNWDDAEKVFDEKWGYLFEDEPSGTEETILEETAVEETTIEETAVEESTEETTAESSETGPAGFSPEVLAWFDYLRAVWQVTETAGENVGDCMPFDYNMIIDVYSGLGIPEQFTIDPANGDLLISGSESYGNGFPSTRYHKIDESHCVTVNYDTGVELDLVRLR